MDRAGARSRCRAMLDPAVPDRSPHVAWHSSGREAEGAPLLWTMRWILLQIEAELLAHHQSRLRVDARKWAAARLAPKKYGDHISTMSVAQLRSTTSHGHGTAHAGEGRGHRFATPQVGSHFGLL